MNWWIMSDLPEGLVWFSVPNGDSQLFITSVTKDPKPSAALHEHQTQTCHTDNYVDKTLMYIKPYVGM